MTPLQRALMELEEAESQLARTLIAHGDGRAPAHAVATARWFAEQCRRQVERLSSEVSTDA